MKIAYKLSLFFAVLISVSACKLDQYSDSTIAIETPKDVFKTYSDAERFGTGLSTYFRSTVYSAYAQCPDIQGDMFNASIFFGNDGGTFHTMNNAFTPSDQTINAMWSGYYSAITNYNYFIENIHYVLDSAALTTGQRAQINVWKGNAYFFRAYNYFELAKKFCPAYVPSSATSELGLPLVTKYDINAKPKRANLQATMDFILADIDSAATFLKKVPGTVRAIDPTIDAVDALKARVSLWVGDWAVAAQTAGRVITDGTYSLAQTDAEMTEEWVNDNGPEDILQLYSNLTENPSSISIFIGRVYQLTKDGYEYDLPNFFPTKRLYSLYETADLRRKAYFEEVPTPYGMAPVTFVKYKGNPALTSASYNACLNRAKIFRISEMYLIKAEAEARQGLPEAKTTLNTLQVARGASPTGGTIEEVQKEWARETPGEGVRIECLKRWNLGFKDRPAMAPRGTYVDGAGYTKIDIPAGYFKLTWPIPTNDMTYNENMEQNKGW